MDYADKDLTVTIKYERNLGSAACRWQHATAIMNYALCIIIKWGS